MESGAVYIYVIKKEEYTSWFNMKCMLPDSYIRLH